MTKQHLWVEAAQAAIDAHNTAANFDPQDRSIEADLFQLIASLIAYCEHNGIDFNAAVNEASEFD